ncbi:hypothetical protein CVT25_006566 [Psilocybe cyanescens]|uniref:Uncharacterized protein n=1 Tax=Psilocybe cyanescens TaxID=93625 RepID=A0A409X430_PSICY|nr:hypothetical protein CVT25_006566 [Psilocybe cyanescens]
MSGSDDENDAIVKHLVQQVFSEAEADPVPWLQHIALREHPDIRVYRQVLIIEKKPSSDPALVSALVILDTLKIAISGQLAFIVCFKDYFAPEVKVLFVAGTQILTSSTQ